MTVSAIERTSQVSRFAIRSAARCATRRSASESISGAKAREHEPGEANRTSRPTWTRRRRQGRSPFCPGGPFRCSLTHIEVVRDWFAVATAVAAGAVGGVLFVTVVGQGGGRCRVPRRAKHGESRGGGAGARPRGARRRLEVAERTLRPSTPQRAGLDFQGQAGGTPAANSPRAPPLASSSTARSQVRRGVRPYDGGGACTPGRSADDQDGPVDSRLQ